MILSMSAILQAPASAPSSRGVRTYDHSDFYPTIRPSDVFLCTYPKSGTTWLAFMIAQVLKRDPQEPIDLKSMGHYVPDVNLLYTQRGSLAEYVGMADPRFFLCHAACDMNLPRVVYVVRDPRDVMVSYWHYQKFLKKDYQQTLAEFISSDDHWPCEWDQHAASWLLPTTHPNLLLLRYEELHEDAGKVLRGVLDFAGVRYTNRAISGAVEASRFDRMRATEDRFGVHGKAGDQRERFVRNGRVGGWRYEMASDDQRMLEQKFGNLMRQLGYL
jgi:estrone sulfotransferase